jgi:two-component system, cell cycle sensor histidine kinase and response regulator CckA
VIGKSLRGGAMGEGPLKALLDDSTLVLSDILDSICAGVMIIDPAGSCSYLNHECTAIIGYTHEDTIADPTIWQRICVGLADRSSSTFAPTEMFGRQITDKASFIPCRDGHLKELQVRVALLPDGSALVTFRPSAPPADTVHRSRDENWQALIEHLPDAILIMDKDARIASYNAAFLNLFGLDREEIKEGGALFVGSRRDAAGVGVFGKLFPGEDAAGAVPAEWDFQKKDGRTVRIESSTSPIRGKDGVLVGYVGLMREKSGPVHEDSASVAEDRCRDIFDNSVLGIFQMTDEGRFISANRAVARIHGYNSPEELMNEVTDVGRHLYVNQERWVELLRILEEKGFVEGFEIEAFKKDRSTNWVSLNVRAARNTEGKIVRVEGTIEEITERKKLESQLLQSQKMEAVGTLAGGVAHDFNNLLMGIQGYTSLMLFNMDASHEHYERLKNIEHLVRSGADLTKQLVGFARGGRYEIKIEDLRDVLSSVTAMFMRTRKEISVHEKYERDLYLVEIDRSQIEHAFLNLYLNAWQAMPNGGHLYVEAENVILDTTYIRLYEMEPGKYVKISVTDTGIGMDERTMDRIFEPFFTTKEMGRGTGLGLASVYGIVKGHQGFINVYSQLGHGTTFNVYIPAAKKNLERETGSSMTDEILQGRETLLLVDDEETIRKVGKEIIEALGYTVILASGGLEAIDMYAARKREIAVVILDMIMPDLDGGRTFDTLKEMDHGVKVILSSGYSLNHEAESIMQRGCKAFIQKPFNVHTLSRVVREVIEGLPPTDTIR